MSDGTRTTVGGLSIGYSNDKYHLDGAVLVHMAENCPLLCYALKSMETHMYSPSENAKKKVELLNEIRKVVEEDVISYLETTRGEDDSAKYKQLKVSMKELLK